VYWAVAFVSLAFPNAWCGVARFASDERVRMTIFYARGAFFHPCINPLMLKEAMEIIAEAIKFSHHRI
jgi:hypothetical protein